MAAVKQAQAHMAEYRGTKPLLLHLGIGVGDPGDTFADLNNATLNVPDKLQDWQVNPSFLADAVECDVFVVALNFNQPDKKYPIKGFAAGQGIHLQVAAPFPLGSRTKSDTQEVWSALRGLAKPAGGVVVLNAVIDFHYEGMLDFARFSWSKKCSSTYINAYSLKKVLVASYLSGTEGGMCSYHGRLPQTLSEALRELDNLAPPES